MSPQPQPQPPRQPGQPRGRSGTIKHPYSALNLRLVLASVGLVVCVVAAVLLAWRHLVIGVVVMAVLAVSAAVDIVVVWRRRRARRKADPHGDYSVFE